jgi:hypothetical protein
VKKVFCDLCGQEVTHYYNRIYKPRYCISDKQDEVVFVTIEVEIQKGGVTYTEYESTDVCGQCKDKAIETIIHKLNALESL